MREAARAYFSRLYEEEFRVRPKLDDLDFARIFEASKQMIEADFSEEEVLECLKSSNRDKAPEPDGFNMFFHKFWNIIKDDVMEVFRETHENDKFVRSLNSTFLILIAKKKGAKYIRDFRPISLIGCIYQLIVKVLASRLSRV